MGKHARALLKVPAVLLGAIAVFLIVSVFWFFRYSRDLPDTRVLALFAPAVPTTVVDPCSKMSLNAIPYTSLGDNLRAALTAVKINESDVSVLASMYAGLRNTERPQRVPLSVQISRTLFCEPSILFVRRLQELRTAVQLERHFSQQELFAIYVNRAYFGDGLTGVQAASRSLFLKEPNHLTIGEAALIAGLVQSPSRFSPLKHPDRALQRRNAVIDAILSEGTINASQAESAKAAPLGIGTPHVSTMPP
jgi:penicillin-binding protein 1A